MLNMKNVMLNMKKNCRAPLSKAKYQTLLEDLGSVCGHILAYTYRHTKLDKECWFGEQYSNLPTEFARNAKRGAPKKQTGRPKNSEKALSKY